MNSRACRFFVMSWLAFTCAAACAGHTLKNFDSVYQHPNSYQDKWISIRGFIGIDELGHEFLFRTLREAREKKYAESIDLIALPGRERGMSLLVNTACADIYGKFNAYGERYIPSGYFLSHAGLINVQLVSACPNY